MYAAFIFKYCVWHQSNMLQQGIFCSQTSFGYKIIFCRAEKIYASVCSMLAMSIADVLSWLNFLITKNVMLAMLLLLPTTWWPRSQGSCDGSFWGLLCSLWLANCWVHNNFLKTICHCSVWTNTTYIPACHGITQQHALPVWKLIWLIVECSALLKSL